MTKGANKSFLRAVKSQNINDEKFELAKLCAELLGFIVNAEGIQVDPMKVEAITEMAAPKDS